MQIDVVSDLAALRRFEADWMRVYAADPEGQFFLSWPWMSTRLEHRQGWSVLMARPAAEAPPVAFFPIKESTDTDRAGRTYREVTLPGRGAADYTGFLCLPEHEVRAGLTFAAYLLGLDWQVLTLECVRASAQRMSGLVDAFAAARLAITRVAMVNAAGVDNSICPYADLPGDWDGYLAGLSANTRQRLRRLLRKIDGTTLRVTVTSRETLRRDIEILLRMWLARWGAQKRRRRVEAVVKSTIEELCDAMANGTLYLPILWHGDRPIAANACMRDVEKRELLFQIGSRDLTAEDLSPGVMLHAHTIRAAIEQGFVRYDFLRGNEPYKYVFATGERRIESLVIRRGAGLAVGATIGEATSAVAAEVTEVVAGTCGATESFA
jgi:CelD/BcsL family acetyltransferase involved in cellulose biosynthesis